MTGLCSLVLATLLVQQALTAAPFDEGTIVGFLNDPEINEASGIAASRKNPGYLYTLNDSGGRARVYAISASDASLAARLDIEGAENCDWEDIAVGPGPGGDTYIYIGDIGGNSGRTCNTLYRVREPDNIQDATLFVESFVRFSWFEPDSETLMVDEQGRVYLVTKTPGGVPPSLHQVPDDAWGNPDRVELSNPSTVNIGHSSNGPVAGDLNYNNGGDILIKTYGSIRWWNRRSGESVQDTLSREGEPVNYNAERQGESVGFSANGDGFYTLSEGVGEPLWFYRRTSEKRSAPAQKVPDMYAHAHAEAVMPTVFTLICSTVLAMLALA